MYRKYYSYSDMPQLVPRQEKTKEEVHNIEKKEPCKIKNNEKNECTNNSNKILGKFEVDDVILAVVILSLLLDDGDDGLLLIALAFVFLTGII